jgi:hypothetical protein
LSKELADFPSIGGSGGSARWSAFMCAEILKLNCLVVSMGRIIPYIAEKSKCSKPPTSHGVLYCKSRVTLFRSLPYFLLVTSSNNILIHTALGNLG